eukprot:CAMPEP_0115311014 /NCGR_PEP_ID=MMETSP0270-20121206/75107_1 /TAXON_ID=71861 /ORGANISM="Scrippsiella trochoidea, Strain CCMP3099" /LENGTH=102 /DNA_ID=CAMNT_0002729813 /DNA_START=257 /DNA_END=566 /DNA_ORIENTATION=-
MMNAINQSRDLRELHGLVAAQHGPLILQEALDEDLHLWPRGVNASDAMSTSIRVTESERFLLRRKDDMYALVATSDMDSDMELFVEIRRMSKVFRKRSDASK